MSETPKTDALSDILRRTRLTAEIYARPDYCGTWAVDTSGQRKVAFHLIQQGSAWLHLEGDATAEPLVTGDLVLFPGDAPHIVSSSSRRPEDSQVNRPPPAELTGPVTSLLCGFFEFRDKSAWRLLDGLPDVVRLDLRQRDSVAGTTALLQLIVGELNRNDPGTDAVINQLASVLFVHVLRSQMATGLTDGLLLALADPKIGKVLNLLHTDLAASWTVSQMAQEAAMSRAAFAKRFGELVGVTPIRYLTEWRMNEARNLLERTDASVFDIALQVGYQSEAAFRKAFRSVTGDPPGRVRRAARS